MGKVEGWRGPECVPVLFVGLKQKEQKRRFFLAAASFAQKNALGSGLLKIGVGKIALYGFLAWTGPASRYALAQDTNSGEGWFLSEMGSGA
jgi:hypothetical protein